MKKFRTHSDTLKDIGREDVAEALNKKKFKDKLYGKLAPQITPEAVAEYKSKQFKFEDGHLRNKNEEVATVSDALIRNQNLKELNPKLDAYIEKVILDTSRQPLVEEKLFQKILPLNKNRFKKNNKFNSDFETAKRKAYQVLTTPEVKPEVTKEPVEQQRVTPQEDIAVTIRRKADETLLRQKKEYAKVYGVHGIASLGKPQWA